MGYAQLVIGRTMNVVNLDPAAEIFNYHVAMKSDWDSLIRNLPWQGLKDIRELVSLEDVMEEVGLGPNGALIYLDDSLHDWVDEELDNYRDDDYLIFDCPGAYMTIPLRLYYLLCFSGSCKLNHAKAKESAITNV
ncbi:hypothetical protein Bca4012_095775 [Brassica carinata]|uniref:GPN-loop GTPase 3 n=1 Tax=Brassica carinata TaxID=52824 RepID=A0A8X7TYT3_BRACI|nr:hypothetical protein Bca52824_078058 [Brassica carinata]